MNVLGFESEDLAVDYDMAEGGALSHNNDIIDIYSNSWGPYDSGFLVEGPDVLAKMALEMGAKEVSHSIHAKFCLDNYTGIYMYVHHSFTESI